jgi:hypothetical protein
VQQVQQVQQMRKLFGMEAVYSVDIKQAPLYV